MHCVELAELASLVSRHASMLLRVRPRVAHASLTQYWVHTRQRADAWHANLSLYSSLEHAGRPVAMQAWWIEHQCLLEEIIVSETLARVFAAAAAALDAATDQQEVGPIAHSVFLCHLEARNRVLQLLLFGRGGSVSQSVTLNRLRRATERWIDRLLAPIAVAYPNACTYAIDASRVQTYVKECNEDTLANTQELAAGLAQAAIRVTLYERTQRLACQPAANQEIAKAVLGCFESVCFDGLGLPQSLRRLRMTSSEPTDQQVLPMQPLFPCLLPNEPPRANLPKAARWLL